MSCYEGAHSPVCGGLLTQRLERFWLELPVLLQQNLDFTFRLFQFFPTGRRKLHALFKQCQRLL